jgi:C_GCAxxG_C_C family probable redox protein
MKDKGCKMQDKTEKKKDVVETANRLHEAGFNCSQSVFATLAPDLGLERETALKIAAPLGGGICRTGEICGAVSGALLAIGLKYGSEVPDPTAKERVYRLGRQFMEHFAERHGSTSCRDLLGCDLSTPEGLNEAREKHLFKTRCPVYIQDAAAAALEMLED